MITVAYMLHLRKCWLWAGLPVGDPAYLILQPPEDIMDDADKQLAKKITHARKIAGLSQTDLAERLGIGLRTLQQYEQGVFLANIKHKTVRKFIDVLNMRHSDFGGLDEDGLPVRITTLDNGEGPPLPEYATNGSAGVDLMAAEELRIPEGGWKLVPCGFAMELPEGYEAQIRPRSGLALRHGVTVLNAPGTIDADYRGEVGVMLVNHGKGQFTVESGMRIAQMVVAPVTRVSWATVDSLSDTERGEGGYGSTGD